MKTSFWKDFFTLLGLVIFEEILNVAIWEMGTGTPRSKREMYCLIGSLFMLLITAIILFRRYQPIKTSILYGVMFGLFAYFPIHLIQYPTVTNLYIIAYKLGLIIIFVLIFQAILRYRFKIRNKKIAINNPEILDDL